MIIVRRSGTKQMNKDEILVELVSGFFNENNVMSAEDWDNIQLKADEEIKNEQERIYEEMEKRK